MKSTHDHAPTPPDPHSRTPADSTGIAPAIPVATKGDGIPSPGSVPGRVGPPVRPSRARTPSHSPVRIFIN